MGTINVHGDGFHLQLDAEREVVTLAVAQPAASFTAECDVAWQAADVLRFQEALRRLLDDLTGVATFSTLEDQVALTIRLEDGTGTVDGRVEADALAALEFHGATDRRLLAQTLTELHAVSRERSLTG